MAAMAQAYPQAYTQPNKGTLIPGQTIAVNKYTVQVERYLSQGAYCRYRDERGLDDHATQAASRTYT